MMLPERVLHTIRRHGLLDAGDRVVVAVSGGPDSMALLESLVELRDRLDVSLCVAHLNHQLRGPAADEDAAFVAARAAALGLPSRIGIRDVARERARSGGSLEHVARRVRYEFLGQVAAETGATKLAVGHTADDQVETILEGLLRGGELGALRGMPVARPLVAAAPESPSPQPSPGGRGRVPEPSPGGGEGVSVVRPLLEVRRAEVLDYLAARGVGYRTDETNADPGFERNAVRHELLPLLRGRLGDGFDRCLLHLAEEARGLVAAVERAADALVEADGDGARMRVGDLAAQPRLVRRAAVHRAFELAGGAGDLRRRAIDAVERLLAGESGRETELTGGMAARRSYGELRLARRRRRPVAQVSLDVPGRVQVPEVGLWVEARALAGEAPEPAHGQRWEEVVDLDRTGDRLEVRTLRAGDRFEPLGLGASKKLKDFLTDERMPRHERERQLVVTGLCGIAWVVGLRLDERAKVRPDTRRLARLRAGNLEEDRPCTRTRAASSARSFAATSRPSGSTRTTG